MRLLFPMLMISFAISCKTQTEKKAEGSIIAEIDETIKKQMKSDLHYLASDELQGRNIGSEGIKSAADFIKKRFETLGLEPYQGDYFDYFETKDLEAYNMVGVLPGKGKLKDEIVIIGAHYDHIGTAEPEGVDSIANGANDNASGSVAVLALAEVFATNPIATDQRTLIFTLFSAEEVGILGSKHLAKRMKQANENVYAMINFEMIGVPMKREELTYLTGYNTSNLAEIFNATNERVTFNWKKGEQMNLFMRSDNYPFYEEFHVPAQTFSSFDFKNFDHYHGVNDEAELMDMDHMTRVVQALIPGIEELIEGDKLRISN